MTLLRKSVLPFLALVLFYAPAFAADNPSPQDAVKRLLDTIGKIKTGDGLSAEEKASNQKYGDLAITFLDLKDVSQQTLGKYWKDRTKGEQEDFVQLLSQLFKKVAFPNSARFFADLKSIYGESQVDKNRAVVPMKVVHEKEGEVGIDFKLDSSDGKWRVYDVVLDGVSMRNNLKSQFYKVIEQNNFAELVRRMKDKL
ncbi:MAG: ABC transporter substrate-binding protein, partial [Nitrospinae bacterium]|nr:ABC transporter substrate-binding protein [Nitrospinota bacterium]